ncbi:hypothetical protein O181_080127 [Austropuccinia psidii MF-1]|uniref:Uncharacterized protein n=1 Tax=Austropuccinia psidii MF-1 TaxID=1389203 RepID=A0A9Q3FL23_9BASI|nr:hypothetical protein [Austropuccinia psidii MF-1]
MPKPLAGGHEPLLTHQEFLDQEKTIEPLGGWIPLSCKEKFKKINNWLKNQILLSIDQKKELEMHPALEKEGPLVSTSSKTAPEVSKDKPKDLRRSREIPRTIKEREKAKQIRTNLTHRGTQSPNWRLQQWKVSSIFPELLCNSQLRSRRE